MTHRELCEITAKRFIKDAQIALFDYSSFSAGEFPDVLVFHGSKTTLYEIKVDRADFLADRKKESRIKYRVKYWPRIERYRDEIIRFVWGNPHLKEFVQECPHLGIQRFYVCPKGLIKPDEMPTGWGLYWYDKRFYLKRKSKSFRRDIRSELSILSHAMRKYASGNGENILINTYETVKKNMEDT